MVDRYPFRFEDREPYRAKIGAVRFAVPNNKRETSKFANVYLYTEQIFFRHHDPYRTNFGAARITVLNTKRLTMPILGRYGSRCSSRPYMING